ncbi:MAG: putative Ig domain-containing protein [Synergistaceae bacterium]|nr:putative Ig domain-containing protein [Synergistaceae bacterium]
MIDVTGSMGWCIDSVKSNVQAFSESLISQGVDARFSIIEFSDQINCSQTAPTTIYRLEGNSYWTSDVSLLEVGLERARQAERQNPGWEETPNYAVYMLLNVLAPTFRSDASRFAFLLTDESNNSRNTEMLDTMENCARRLKQANIRTSVISLENLRWEFEVLCTETEGKYINLRTPNYYLMMLDIADWVAEVTGLTVHVMERSALHDKGNIDSPETPNLICDARSSNGYYDYYDGKLSLLTEKKLANITTPDPYIKNGYTADGNTRLVIRVQHNRPGKVYFDVGSEFGTLEILSRRKISAATPIETTEIQPGKLYQASVVLVAPESFPLDTSAQNDGFPVREFDVGVKFECACGDANCACGTEEPPSPIKLEIHATPVLFIHGFDSSFPETFVRGDTNGIFSQIDRSGIYYTHWNYTNTEGPTTHIIKQIESGFHSEMFKYIAAVFKVMLSSYNVACTRVDLICHSMGGLMARTFLAYEDRMSSRSYYNSMVRRVITVATPHEGSPLITYLAGKAESLPFLQNMNTLDSNEIQAVADLRNANILSLTQADYGKTDSYTPGAWADLELDNALAKYLRNNVGKPSVPIHVIYGTVDNGQLAANLRGIYEAFRHHLVDIPKAFTQFFRGDPKILDNFGLFSALFRVLFNDDFHDMCVGMASAVSIFDNSFITTENGIYKNHSSICHEESIGRRVLDLLKGNLSNFDTSGVGRASNYTFPSNSYSPLRSSQFIPANNGAVSDFFLSKYTLKVTTPTGSEYTAPAAFTVGGSSDITFTLTAEKPVEHDIYLSIGNENGGSFLMMQSADNELKTFTAAMTLPQNYSGTMNIHAFSSPNAEDEGHVYISGTLEVNIIPELNAGSSIQSLSFMGRSAVITDVDAQTALGVFAVTNDGEYIDVSVPAVANELGINCYFADAGIAEITENGKIRGLSSGSTTLTAEYNGTSAVISVDVGINQDISEMPVSTDKTLFITTESLSEGQAGVFYNQVLASTISFTDYVAWSASGLPEGIACDISGILSGKPLASGTYSVDITASSDRETASRTLSLVITPSNNPYAPIISTHSLPSGYINQEYSADITAAALGDKSSMTWRIYSGSLPEGLSFAGMNGEVITLSGIPTESGSFPFMIEADLNGYSDIQSLTLVISAISVPEITTSSLPSGTVGTAYSAQLQASGSPLTWGILAGNLPNGLVLSEDTGIISGTPSVSGNFAFSVSAANLAGMASRDFSITINAASVPSPSPSTEPAQDEPETEPHTSDDVTPPEPKTSDDVTPPDTHTSDDIIPPKPHTSDDITPPDEPHTSDDITPPEPHTSDDITPPDEPHTSDDITPPDEPHTSDDITPPDEPHTSDDITPSEDITPPEPEDIETGPERGVASLNSYELAQVSNDRNMVAAVLPEVTVNVAGVYDFTDIDLAENVPIGAVLEWHPFERPSSVVSSAFGIAADSGVQFFDADGREITTVPASRNIDVSAYLEAGKTYAPVISAVISEHNDHTESQDIHPESHDTYHVGSSGGGCVSGMYGIWLLSVLGLFLKSKH